MDGGREAATWMALKTQEGAAMSQQYRQLLEAGKGKETDSTREPSKEPALPTPRL